MGRCRTVSFSLPLPVSRAGEAAAPKTNGGGEAVVVGEKGEDEAAKGEEGRDVTEGEGAGLFLATTTFFLVAAPRTGLTAARKRLSMARGHEGCCLDPVPGSCCAAPPKTKGASCPELGEA